MTSISIGPIEVVKRDGSRVPFQSDKVQRAIENAFRDVHNIASEQPTPASLHALVEAVAKEVIESASRCAEEKGNVDIETIQDLVEKQLMAAEQYEVAKSYILYREERHRARILKGLEGAQKLTHSLMILHKDGTRHPLDISKIRNRLLHACEGFESLCSAEEILEEAILHLYEGAASDEVHKALIFASRAKIEREPAYAYVTARLLLQQIYMENLSIENFGKQGSKEQQYLESAYRKAFADYVHKGVGLQRLSPELLEFDLKSLAMQLVPARDYLFQYLGLQILYDRYLLRDGRMPFEAPQFFWMRVAMGLALKEPEKEKRAKEFYDVLSQFLFVSSTPTLFNSGTLHPQLSSCYLSTIHDDLNHIFKVIADNARLSKWAGGIGNDWTYVRGTGALIKGTNGLTQGIIPFLKVANDTAVAVNQGGKRKGAFCAYLETWHLDIEDFLELRKNTGDERRRTHDMNTANWVPDLFMKRVQSNSTWTLFNPNEVSDLHDLYGKAFEKRYEEYERMAIEGKLFQHKTLPAIDLWRKMITMLFETGHPWITFKDPCNIRSPQSHVGVVHSSNLCTEITLNTSETETAVCNLGSLNLAAHLKKHKGQYRIDKPLLAQTIETAMRMLDNVIDINFYPTAEARESNLRHRPVGLGLMAFQDLLYRLRIPYDSDKAVELADETTEFISYHALLASAKMANERGPYSTFHGSKWSQGVLPIDSLDLLEKERGGSLDVSKSMWMDWEPVRQAIRKYGMRNSNTLAIAPTATIAHISGVCPSMEPTYSNLFSRSNLSGEFTSLNPYLVEELKALGIWDPEMVDELKYYDGSIEKIEGIPNEIKELFKTAFEIEPSWLIECAGRRQKWLDMSQSLNLYVKSPSGKNLSDMYFLAWKRGLKTTYYLRSTAATQVEKSTIDINKKGIQPRWMKSRSASSNIQLSRDKEAKSCNLNEGECESCQ